jgi:NADH-quinone oxidoreductase subunit M
MYILSLLIFIPLLTSIGVFLLPENQKQYARPITLIVTAIELLISVWIYFNFNRQTADYQLIEYVNWISLSLGKLGVLEINYALGIDGISMPMVLLTGIVMFVGAVASVSIQSKTKGYYALFLLLTASVMGCFLALDFFLFFLFFEFMLLPMYFLIGIWGGENREYASIKFFIYTLIGSIFILVVMIALGSSVVDMNASMESGLSIHTLDFRLLSDKTNYLPDSFLNNSSFRGIAFWLLFIGFAIKLPMVPFHTWLPDAHVEAPTPISVVLAGILLKIGGYGFIRIAYSFFPDMAQEFAVSIAILGLISIIYGAYNALGQEDLKKMIAYSSVSHMGFVLLGLAALNAEGISGAVFQMFSHGILSAMLFLIVGVIYDRTHDRRIENFRGLASQMPLFTGMTAVAFFASLGLPAFSGFIGEIFSIIGAFNSAILPKWIPIVSTLGIILAAVYFLYTFQRMFLGKFWANRDFESKMIDLNNTEKALLFSLAFLAFIFGIFPQLIFDITNVTITQFLKVIIGLD